ncbi:MAG: ATP-binding protein [Betaproteobacteria bacterium]|nr:ATP-binding protein [Betaproteobacteria bacterium]
MEFVNRTADCCVAPEREVEVFHIVQEALANVGRHAEAKNVRVTLDRHGEDFEVVVEDDGAGFADAGGAEAADAAGHFGLSIMRERAAPTRRRARDRQRAGARERGSGFTFRRWTSRTGAENERHPSGGTDRRSRAVPARPGGAA